MFYKIHSVANLICIKSLSFDFSSRVNFLTFFTFKFTPYVCLLFAVYKQFVELCNFSSLSSLYSNNLLTHCYIIYEYMYLQTEEHLKSVSLMVTQKRSYRGTEISNTLTFSSSTLWHYLFKFSSSLLAGFVFKHLLAPFFF